MIDVVGRMLYAAVHKPSLQVYTAYLSARVGISFSSSHRSSKRQSKQEGASVWALWTHTRLKKLSLCYSPLRILVVLRPCRPSRDSRRLGGRHLPSLWKHLVRQKTLR